MALSRKIAKEIVDVVARDPYCNDCISSVIAFLLPDQLGLAGSVRNMGMILIDTPNYLIENLVNAYRKRATKSNKQSFKRYDAPKNFSNKDPKVDKIICTGIAEATSKAIKRAMESSRCLSQEIKGVRMGSRLTGAAHAGTLIEMKDGSNYIFDWHNTLNVRNPMIYQLRNWHNRVEGTTFENFMGLK